MKDNGEVLKFLPLDGSALTTEPTK
jgi:hypothetical protein